MSNTLIMSPVRLQNEIATAECNERARLYEQGILWIASRSFLGEPEMIVQAVQNAAVGMLAFQFQYSQRAVWKRVKERIDQIIAESADGYKPEAGR